jgi:glycosyltransferase involved in cell wall biosynthesis
MVPDISIVITNYNYGKYLPRCLRSCISQINVTTDVIVVDDCSEDPIDDIIAPFADHVRLIKNPKNMGVAYSSNIGLKSSKSQYFIRVDADDFITSDMCYIMKRYLETNHDAFCVSSDYYLVDNQENIIERKYAKIDNISCGVMYRKDLLIELGGYNDNFRHKEEEELRKRLGDAYKIHHLEIPFYRYRMHQHNKTKTKEYKLTSI